MFTNASFKWTIKTSFNYIFIKEVITYMTAFSCSELRRFSMGDHESHCRRRFPRQNSLQLSLKPCPHCRRKVRQSQITARQRRQSHFSATVWTGFNWAKHVGVRAGGRWSPPESDKAVFRHPKLKKNSMVVYFIERRMEFIPSSEMMWLKSS